MFEITHSMSYFSNMFTGFADFFSHLLYIFSLCHKDGSLGKGNGKDKGRNIGNRKTKDFSRNLFFKKTESLGRKLKNSMPQIQIMFKYQAVLPQWILFN